MTKSMNDLIQVTREVEVTEGVVVGAARLRVYGTAPTYTPGGNRLTSGINTGDGGVKSIRQGLRFADSEVPSELVFELNHEELEDVLRDTWDVAEVTTASISATFDPAGTHEDTSTGPTITASAADFNNFVGKEGAMIETTAAAADPANVRPRVLKAISADGSKIDIDPIYTAGVVGEISEPLIAEGPIAACVFNLGKILRNQGALNIRSVNFEYDFSDQSGGSFVMARGQKASSMKLSFDGKGNVILHVGYTGMDYDDLTNVTQGNGTVTPNPGIDNDQFSSGDDLSYFLLNGVNQIACDALTSFSLDGNGNASGDDETSGCNARTGVSVGDLDFTGSFKLLHEHTKMAIAMAFARAGTRIPLDWKFVDPAGNFYWWRLPKAMFDPFGPKPGAKNSKTDGTVNFGTQLGASGVRTLIVQAFAAP